MPLTRCFIISLVLAKKHLA